MNCIGIQDFIGLESTKTFEELADEFINYDVNYDEFSEQIKLVKVPIAKQRTPKNLYDTEDDITSKYSITSNGDYKCDMCGFSRFRKDALIQHMKVHTNQRNFTCDICGKSFKYKSVLQEHMNTHTKARVHKCPYCDYTCLRKSNIAKHVNAHVTDKIYKCNNCDYKTNRRETLKRHNLKHCKRKKMFEFSSSCKRRKIE